MEFTHSPRIAIIGASTGGASAAAQLRRLDEHADITIFEKSPHISTAYCGLAYGLGGVVEDPETLIPLQPNHLQQRFNIKIHTQHEVLAIDADNKTLTVKNCISDNICTEKYDRLLISTGAATALPDIPGLEHDGIFGLRTVPDLQAILFWIAQHQPSTAVVAGGGFIGVEVAENLMARGIETVLIQDQGQVMTHLDPEMAAAIAEHITSNDVRLLLNTSINAITPLPKGLRITLSNGSSLDTELLIMATGTAPQTQLAQAADIEIGSHGGIVVDASMQTSIQDIYAIGDAVELPSRITGAPTMVQLAAPLSQQARVAAANILGRHASYPGVLGTFVCKIFDMTVGAVGLTETVLKQQHIPYRKVIVPTTNHVFFYPGSQTILLKLLFDPDHGRLLGAQAVGGAGSDKRIDILAVAISAKMTIFDLEYLELAYAPPYGAPRDPVNLAGSVAANLLRGDISGIYPDELAAWQDKNALVLDVRTAEEYELGTLPGAINIPMEQLRERTVDLPKDRTLILCCQIGSKATSSQRMLQQKGYDCLNLLGGYDIWRLFQAKQQTPSAPTRPEGGTTETAEAPKTIGEIVDVRGLRCPGPILTVRQFMRKRAAGEWFTILVDDTGFLKDFTSWCQRFGHSIHDVHKVAKHHIVICSKSHSEATQQQQGVSK